jgi:hypothetical protein
LLHSDRLELNAQRQILLLRLGLLDTGPSTSLGKESSLLQLVDDLQLALHLALFWELVAVDWWQSVNIAARCLCPWVGWVEE